MADTLYNQLDDAVLVRLSKQGDTHAFVLVVERHTDALYTLALCFSREPEDAEDLVVRAVALAWENLATIRHDQAISNWLTSTVENLGYAQLRRRYQGLQVEPLVEEPEDTSAKSVADAAADRVHVEQIYVAMPDLSTRQKWAVTMRYLGNMSYAQIASHMKVPQSTAKSLVRRGIAALRRLLGPPDRP